MRHIAVPSSSEKFLLKLRTLKYEDLILLFHPLFYGEISQHWRLPELCFSAGTSVPS